MNALKNTEIIYLILSAVFSSFVLYACIQFTYTYIKMHSRQILAPLLFSCIAFIYIVSDMFALIYSVLTPVAEKMRFFILLRELIPLFFLIAAPLFLNHIIQLQERIKKINTYIFRAGICSTIIIIVITLILPDFFISIPANFSLTDYPWMVSAQKNGPLFIIKIVLLMIYLLYTIAIYLYLNINHKTTSPGTSNLIGFIVLCYFGFNMIYSIFFYSNNISFAQILYRNFSIGMTIFIIFVNFGIIDLFIDNTAQLTKLRNNIERIMNYDAELGIPNRNGFLKDLSAKVNEMQKMGIEFSLIVIDIDDFQSFNECFGEIAGDEILKLLSQRITDFFIQEGNLYRIGGDEFAFLSNTIKYEKDSIKLAEKMITSFRNPFKISGIDYLVTACIGILQLPRDGFDSETILSNAYSVIRKAKKNKNTFAVFSSELIDVTSNKINIVNILRNSIAKDEFTLFYQPIVDRNGKIYCAEALIRCTNTYHPATKNPSMFLPLIEEAGFMKELDDMVIRKAFRDMEFSIREKFSISINLSTNQLINTSYSDFLSSFAKQHRIENKQITLEVTESKLIENLSSGRDNLLKLKKNGFNIALDDFGTGFSSLVYLAELPIDIIKIDMALVKSTPGDPRKESIARYILEMAHSLNLKVVAEGFETREQIDFFKGLGCDLYQGYYYSRPVLLDEILAKYPD
jgi:diguanylate cyclase (GGDEF)-like protein